MRHCRFIALFVLSLLVACLQPLSLPAHSSPFSQPEVRIYHRYYAIAGSTASELRAQMIANGPRDRIEGLPYDAHTDWAVKWAFRHMWAGNRCTIRSASAQVAVTYTLPKWVTPKGAERSLVAEWRQYLTALQNHEEGHKENGIGAAQEVLTTLQQLPAASSCRELETTAQAAAQSVIRTYNQRDVNYDRVTHHGYTQGAVFPDVTTVSR